MIKAIMKPIGVILALMLFISILSMPMTVAAAEPIIDISSGFDNLFSKMSRMLPGQTVTDYFTVKNVSTRTADFFFEAKQAALEDFQSDLEKQGDSETLLSLLDLKVVLFNAQNEASIQGAPGILMYEGKADQLTPIPGSAALIGQTLKLGTLKPKQAVTIQISVSAPKELDNSFSNMQGKFWWTFTATQIEGEPASSKPAPSSSATSSPSSKPPASSSMLPPASSNSENNGDGNNGGGTPVIASSSRVRSSIFATSSSIRSAETSSSLSSNQDEDVSSVAGVSSNETTNVDDKGIPLSPLSDVLGIANMFLAIISLVISVIVFVKLMAKKNIKKQSDGAFENEYDGSGDLQDKKAPRKHVSTVKWRLLAVAAGVVTAVLFIYTSDFGGKIVIADRWTVWVALAMLVQLGLLLLARRQDLVNSAENQA